MPEILTKLKINGYHYDPESFDQLDSIFYESDITEDDWIKISKVSGGVYETYVIDFVVGCEDTLLKTQLSFWYCLPRTHGFAKVWK